MSVSALDAVSEALTVPEAIAQLSAAIEAENRRNAVRDEMLATVIVNLERSELTADFAVKLRDYVRAERAKLSALTPVPESPSPAIGQEPVAWVLSVPDAEPFAVLTKKTADYGVVQGWSVRPLYAHPPASKPAQGEGVAGTITPERVQQIAHNLCMNKKLRLTLGQFEHLETALTEALTSQEQSKKRVPLIDDMSQEEFEQDRSDENPTVGFGKTRQEKS